MSTISQKMSVSDRIMPPNNLQAQLRERSGEISMLPDVALRAMRLADDPECNTIDFSKIIMQDITLAAEVLSQANSVLYSLGRPVSTVENAVVRLGLKQCKSLIIASSAACVMKKLPLHDEWIRQVLWQHGQTTATACSCLNRAFSIGFNGEEIVAGLLHDFGRFLVAVSAPQKFAIADALEFVEDENTLAQEREILGIDHSQFGGWFADQCGLPEDLIAVLRFHHQPELEHEHQKLVALTAAADHFANHIQREERVEDYDPSSNLGLEILRGFAVVPKGDKLKSISTTLLNDIHAILTQPE